ncbi:hypothetical protein [Priestia aryabhattai]|uniref:hypothetical protein n=1 Tax=Priestia aryabhattai TaxID=412384 RepID=UPI002E21E34E|nr:hypothetical protein [Priestia aryabhattai]
MTKLIKEIENLIQELKEMNQKFSESNYDKNIDLAYGALIVKTEEKLYELEKYDFDKFVELQELCVEYF